MQSRHPIIIAGGGPVGVVTALALARQGLEVRLFEAAAGVDDSPRAATTHAATLEMLESLGLVEEVTRRGLIEPKFRIWDRANREIIVEFDFAMLSNDTRFPHVVQCEQHKLAHIALDRLKALANVTVEFSARVRGFEQRADRVEVEVESANGSRRLTGSYLIGADGGRSTVRKALDIEFEGYTHPERFLVLTTTYAFGGEFAQCSRNYFSDPHEWCALFKVTGDDGSGLWRVVFPTRLEESDAQALATEAASVQAAAPTARFGAIVVNGNENWSTSVVATTPDYLTMREWRLAAGRTFDAQDLDTTGTVAILGRTVATQLFGQTGAIGQVLRIGSVPFAVIGVLEARGQTSWGEDLDDLVLIPLSTGRQRLVKRSLPLIGWVDTIVVKVREGTDLTVAEAEISAILRQQHRLRVEDADDFQVRNPLEALELLDDASGVLSVLLGGIGSVSLFVGGIGIMNIMLASVAERTREIGVRMALGADVSSVLRLVLGRGMGLAAIGVGVGLVCAAGVTRALSSLLYGVSSVDPLAFGSAAVVLLAVALVANLLPARRATKVDPMVALRWD
jgi:2-polyprenyl-6-methoxyphenol hydroxylase-like FAD-dependent oxidoreductase